MGNTIKKRCLHYADRYCKRCGAWASYLYAVLYNEQLHFEAMIKKLSGSERPKLKIYEWDSQEKQNQQKDELGFF